MEQSIWGHSGLPEEGIVVHDSEHVGRERDAALTKLSHKTGTLQSPRIANTVPSDTERETGLLFQAATTLDAVQAAWSLVYDRYVSAGLIEANSFSIYTHPQAVGTHACVVFGPIRGHVVSTMTLIADNPRGLPLDSVYGRELQEFRASGRRLLEVGLLADRRAGVTRGGMALFDMMRWSAYYAYYVNATDVIVGVHPHHARFYERCFGFKSFGPTALYPMVRDNPVVPLRLRVEGALDHPILPRGLRHIRDNPLPLSLFDKRFGFRNESLRGSRVEGYIRAKVSERGGRGVKVQ